MGQGGSGRTGAGDGGEAHGAVEAAAVALVAAGVAPDLEERRERGEHGGVELQGEGVQLDVDVVVHHLLRRWPPCGCGRAHAHSSTITLLVFSTGGECAGRCDSSTAHACLTGA